MNALKQRGVLCRVLKYPGEGHSLEAKPETSADCTLNIALWLDKYLIMEAYPQQQEAIPQQHEANTSFQDSSAFKND